MAQGCRPLPPGHNACRALLGVNWDIRHIDMIRRKGVHQLSQCRVYVGEPVWQSSHPVGMQHGRALQELGEQRHLLHTL